MQRLSMAALLGLALGSNSAEACLPPGASLPDRMPRPVDGSQGETFGMRQHPLLGTVKMHTGLDFDAPTGQPVLAPARGEVVVAQWVGQNGNHVRLRHGGDIETTYSHLSRIEVKAGDCLDAGALLGRVGSTGLSVGPHLHFEVLRGGTPVDPLPLIEPLSSSAR